MAYVRKRGNKYQVRWRDVDGRQRYRSCPDRKTAKLLQHEVDQAVALGIRWEEPDREPPKLLEGVAEAWLKDSRRTKRPSTVGQRAIALTMAVEWIQSRHPRRQLDLGVLNRTLLEELHDHLVHERGVSKLTANDRLRHVFNFWEWAFDHDDYPECPRPKRIELPEANPKLARVAPTWEQMDEGVHAAGTSWYRQLFVVLRYTGLRRSQAMQLLWTDFDFEAGNLSIRPELGKTRQERRGRVVPVSPHLLEELAGWGRREGFVIDTRRVSRGKASTSRTVHHGYVKTIWTRTSVPEDRYRQPCHCFRKGFISGLLRSGAREYAVKRLVGHASGVTIDVYADDSAIESDLRAAVAMVPRIAPQEQPKVISLDKNGVREGSAAISASNSGAAE